MFGLMKAKQATQMEDFIAYKERIGALADGHGGHHGATLAIYACERIVNELSALDSKGEVNPAQFFETMPMLFEDIHREYLYKMSAEMGVVVTDGVPMRYGSVVRGGSTLTALYKGSFQGQEYIMTANVGDSDAFLFSVKDGVYRFKQLTFTHEPTSEQEYQRVQTQCGAQAAHFVYDTKGATTSDRHLPIFDAKGKLIHYEDTYKPFHEATTAYQNAWHALDQAKKAGLPTDELRATLHTVIEDYNVKKLAYGTSPDSRRFPSTARGDRGAYIMVDTVRSENTTKLAMTRSVGDYQAHKNGLTCEPFVSITDMTAEELGDRAMLFTASDGVLDCFEMEELARIVLTVDQDQWMNVFHAKEISLFQKNHDDLSFIAMRLK